MNFENKKAKEEYPLKRSDPWPIKAAYLLIYVSVGLWMGALVCEVLTGW